MAMYNIMTSHFYSAIVIYSDLDILKNQYCFNNELKNGHLSDLIFEVNRSVPLTCLCPDLQIIPLNILR